ENGELAEQAGLDAIADLQSWDTWTKENVSRETVATAYDFLKAFTGLLDKTQKAIIKDGQGVQLQALNSFSEMIMQGKSLADLKAEHAKELAAAKLDAIAQVNTKLPGSKQSTATTPAKPLAKAA